MSSTESPARASNSKITEAFELLNEAAREKRSEMKELMTDKYVHIKQAVLEGTTQGKQILDKAQYVTQEALVEAGEKMKKVAEEVDKNVRENPWPYLGGVAVAALILGFLMGSRRR